MNDRTVQAEALELFTESLDVPTRKRYSWLAERCQQQPTLLPEVMRLLEADQVNTGILDTELLPSNVTRSGQRLGAFELTRVIGAGGMGRVYEARRADGAYQQSVAVKVFELAIRDQDAMRRFHLERQILASLEHPAIARLIDGGEANDGTPYVVMELIQGQPITRYCSEHELDLEARLRLFKDVCNALHVAHEQGIVHRDIKPGNVLVTEQGQPKIIDFGIAKVLDMQGLDAALPKTSTQMQMLTPEYASPEQVRHQTISPVSDVYSLGVVLYEMLTGSRPYHVSSLTPAEIERTVCQSVPLDPSDQVSDTKAPLPSGLSEARILKRKLHGDIDRIVMTALRKDPKQRYQSAQAFGDDIGHYLAGEPVTARGASKLYRARKLIERNAGLSIGIVTAFVMLIVALIMVSLQAEQARHEATRAAAVKDFLIEMIGRADPFGDSETPTLGGALRQAAPTVSERFAGQPDLQAEVRYALGFAFSGLGETALARTQLEQALATQRELGNQLEVARTLNALANVSWEDSDYEQAKDTYETALEAIEGRTDEAALQVRFGILTDFGALLPKMDQYAEGLELSQQALAMSSSLQDVETRTLAVIWNNIATAYDGLEGYDNSIAAYEKSIELHRQAGAPHPDLAIALGNLGLTYEFLQRMDLAVSTVTEAVTMHEQMLGPDHPQTALYTYNLGSLRLNAGDIAGAIKDLATAAQSAETAYAPNHLYTGRFNHRLAVAYLQAGDMDLARQHARYADRIYQARDDVPQRWLEDLAELGIEL
ncbi:MAG: hypothetical protein DHS20C11_21100 [Lysobacteraceae bacterium]|nr:MAG: hypothetical protein DHS20C11_21100 [Xanthomonadaceae bacterium]